MIGRFYPRIRFVQSRDHQSSRNLDSTNRIAMGSRERPECLERSHHIVGDSVPMSLLLILKAAESLLTF